MKLESSQTEKPSGSKWKRVLKILIPLGIAFVYDLFPIDMIPDFIPFLGWVDDVLVTLLSLYLSYKKYREKTNE